MSVYTVHEPPLRAAEALADPRRLVFVRDGFYLWAFLLTPLWLIWHRLWLVLVLYLLATAGVDTSLHLLGGSYLVVAFAGVLISLLVGLEGGTLRRASLARRRWSNVGLVSGDTIEDAELRFFDRWLKRPSVSDRALTTTTPAARPAMPPASSSEPPGVIGLFPEPGAQR